MVARKLATKFGEDAERREGAARGDGDGGGAEGGERHKGNRFCVNRDPCAHQPVFSLFFSVFLLILPCATARHFVFPNL